MPVLSAGIVLYRVASGIAEVLLVHPGGPYWMKKDAGAWSIPKGVANPGEEPFAAACREFAEETGAAVPGGPAIPLGAFQQNSSKTVVAFAVRGDFDTTTLHSNAFTMEWPPKSGKAGSFPEVDRAGWFTLAVAGKKIVAGQRPILTALATHLGGG